MTRIQFLSSTEKKSIHDGSLNILENTGIRIKNAESIQILGKAGCEIESNLCKIPPHLIEESLKKSPSSFELHSQDEKRSWIVGDDNVIYNPGSSVSFMKDRKNSEIRKGTVDDLIEIIQIVEKLEYINAQSTALIPSDIPEVVKDFTRLYLVLNHSTKPVITGAFRKDGINEMWDLLVAIRGADELRSNPSAIFDCCPTSPLTWSEVAAQNLIDCAKLGLPVEIVPAPLMGATSPITIRGTLIQTNAEILSGVVLAQLVNPGIPVIYGGAIAPMDMRYTTPRFASSEAMIASCSSAEIGKMYNLPTHAYIGLSDSKTEDSQAGYESGIGLVLAALVGINIVSGPGVLAYINCQSLEKLVIDNELCGSAYRFIKESSSEDIDSEIALIQQVGHGGDFLKQKHTSQYLRSEHFMPSPIIDRLTIGQWIKEGSKSTLTRAKEFVNKILNEVIQKEPNPELYRVFTNLIKKYDLTIESIF